MPYYVPKALAKFKHPQPLIPQHAPLVWTMPVYRRTTQYSTTDNYPLQDEQATKQVQAIVGTFLYYAHAVPALNETSNQQSKPKEKTMKACRQLMDYLYTHPKATLYTLTEISTSEPPTIKSNGPVHVQVKTIHGVPASASEADTAGIFLGAQEAVPMLNTLVELGHPQPSHGTPIETDNSTAHDILKAQVCLKVSKAFDMCYHWIKDRIAQGQFNHFWDSGKQNCGDYFTKHHPLAYHLLMCPSTFTQPAVYLSCKGLLVCIYPTHSRP